jgi:hypothetical protein
MCSTPTTPPPRSSEIWWSERWDRQRDGVVPMVESSCRQGFAHLLGERKKEKEGFRNRAAAPRKIGQPRPWCCGPCFRRPALPLHQGLGHTCPPPLGASVPCKINRTIDQCGLGRCEWPGQCGPLAQGPAGPASLEGARKRGQQHKAGLAFHR